MYELLTLSYVMNFEVEIFFLDDSNVTSRAFRIHADHVCNGCDGRCKASVVWFGCVVDQVWCRFAECAGLGPKTEQHWLLLVAD